MEGISFLVKVHNEEATLYESVMSLAGLLVTYEILIFLNACTDASGQIARTLENANPRIKVFEYNVTLSRPGYETLATDDNSVHSISRYYNWCLSHAKYKWIAKWDADFVMTDPLRDYLNAMELNRDVILRLGARSRDGVVEMNNYFSSCIRFYKKELFTEMVGFVPGCPTEILDHQIDHLSSLSNVKPYWHRPGWYTNELSEEAAIVAWRVKRLTEDFGLEPVGNVRSENINNSLALGYKILYADLDYVSRND
jgi:glycosyltransferase involved in cell wall biosynthesis